MLLAWIAFFYCGVVRAEFSKQSFVVSQESRHVRQTLVPNHDDPAIRLEGARKFDAGGVLVEPVERLASGDKIYARVIERGGFRGALDACKTVIRGKIFFACLAHCFVGFDAEDAVAIFQEELAQETRAGADVGDHMP